MPTVSEIYSFIDSFAPFSTAMDFDNSGLLIGSFENKVKGCLLALDITNEVVDRVLEQNANLIITHHPVIFNPLKSVSFGGIIYRLVKNDINVISAHTNLDLSEIGVNSALSKKLGLTDAVPFANRDSLGKIGKLPFPMTATELAHYVKEKLNAPVSYIGGDKEIKTVAVIGGSGKGYLDEAFSSADAFITGEVSHDVYVEARNKGFTLITAGHYVSEAVVLPELQKMLGERFFEIKTEVADGFNLNFEF